LSVLVTDPSAVEKRKQIEEDWRKQTAKYEKDLEKQRADAEHLDEEALKKKEEAEEKMEASHHSHARAVWLDAAHLAVELALVFCAIAVLTKRKDFWLTGIVCCVIGAGIAVYAQFLMH